MILTTIEFYGGPIDGMIVDFDSATAAHKIKVSTTQAGKRGYPEAEYTLIFKNNLPYYVYDLIRIKQWLES